MTPPLDTPDWGETAVWTALGTGCVLIVAAVWTRPELAVFGVLLIAVAVWMAVG